jgi:hypothetical protein
VWKAKRRKRLVCLEEGLIHADDLTGEELEIVKRYWRSGLLDTAADQTDAGSAPALRLRSESDFRKLICEATYNHGPGSYVLVGQNIDFDISRCALDWRPARDKVRCTGSRTARSVPLSPAHLYSQNYALDEHGKPTKTQQELHRFAVASKRYALVNTRRRSAAGAAHPRAEHRTRKPSRRRGPRPGNRGARSLRGRGLQAAGSQPRRDHQPD